MKSLRKLALSSISLVIIFSSLLYIGCEGDDDNVDDYFSNNPYKGNPDRESFADTPASTNIPPAPAALSISPTSANANPGQRIGFQAAGGSGSYVWSVGISAHGNVAPQSNTKYAVYTHVGSSTDINNVIVTDSAGAVAISNIN